MTKMRLQATIVALIISAGISTAVAAKTPAEMCEETITKMAMLDAQRSAPLMADQRTIEKHVAKNKKRYLTPSAISACSKRVNEETYACKVRAETMKAFRKCERS